MNVYVICAPKGILTAQHGKVNRLYNFMMNVYVICAPKEILTAQDGKVNRLYNFPEKKGK